MSQPIYKTRKGSIISQGSASSGAVTIANNEGKIDASWLQGFGEKRIEFGSSSASASSLKVSSSTILFDQAYEIPPMVFISLKTLYWNTKNSAGSIVVNSSTDSFTVNFIVNNDSADSAWNITNSISFDWFSIGNFTVE